jgi:hypothetical protein
MSFRRFMKYESVAKKKLFFFFFVAERAVFNPSYYGNGSPAYVDVRATPRRVHGSTKTSNLALAISGHRPAD